MKHDSIKDVEVGIFSNRHDLVHFLSSGVQYVVSPSYGNLPIHTQNHCTKNKVFR